MTAATSPTSASVIELDAQFPAQDYVLINGEKSPGKAIIQRPNSPRGWDERKGYALTGATLMPTGNPLAEFSVLFQFWDPADMPTWYAFAAKYFDESVRFNPGTMQPRALGINHPLLSAPPIRITAVVVVDAIAHGMVEETGIWQWEIFFKRYRKAKIASPAPIAAIPAAASAKPIALDAAQIENQEKTVIFQSLAGST